MCRIILTIIVTLLLSNFAYATNYACGPSATGSGTGADYDNLLDIDTAAASSSYRGHTLYLVDGAYSSLSVTAATSGTDYITIKKAIASDYGGLANWVSTYGDGQAVFTSQITISTDYVVIDGNGTHTVPSNDTDD